MIHINLLPLKIRQERVRRLRNVFLIGSASVLILVLGWLYFQKRSQLDDIKEQIVQIEKELGSPDLADKVQLVNQMQAREKAVKAKLAVLEDVHQDQTVWLSFLDDLSNRLVPEVWFSSIKKMVVTDKAMTGKMVELAGVSLSKEAVVEFFHNLERSPNVNSVALLSVSAVSRDGAPLIYNFKISCEVKVVVFKDF